MSSQPTTRVMESAPGPETVIDGRRYIYFGGTNYLGLAGHPEVVEAACAAVRRFGVHTATSRHGFGNNPLTLEVEQRAAAFFGTEGAFYFASGYMANQIHLRAFEKRVDRIFIDESAHYSLFEAARALGKPVVQFRHCDPEAVRDALDEQLKAHQRPLLLSDGVFSVSGAMAPAKDYVEVLRDFAPAIVHLDDAHGVAVVGENGRGVWEHLGIWGPDVNSGIYSDNGVTLSVCGTLAKGVGGFGGIIPGSKQFLSCVRSASHYFEGASAPSSADAGATAKALEIIEREPRLRSQLRANATRLRNGARKLGLTLPDSPAANFSVTIGNGPRMQNIHDRLAEAGFLVPYFPSYSGTGSNGALRFAACALHTPQMIDDLLAELGRLV